MNEFDGKLKEYFKITEKALKEIEFNDVNKEMKKIGESFLDMSKRYFRDAEYFRSKGEKIEAFSAINYAHAFLDAGALAGIFKIKNKKLLMVD